MNEQLESERTVLAAIKAIEDKDLVRFKFLLAGIEGSRSVLERALDMAHKYMRLYCHLEQYIREDSPELDALRLCAPIRSVADEIQWQLNEMSGIELEDRGDLWSIEQQLSREA